MALYSSFCSSENTFRLGLAAFFDLTLVKEVLALPSLLFGLADGWGTSGSLKIMSQNFARRSGLPNKRLFTNLRMGWSMLLTLYGNTQHDTKGFGYTRVLFNFFAVGAKKRPELKLEIRTNLFSLRFVYF